MALIVILLLNILLSVSADEQNVNKINFVTLDGVLHDGIAIDGNVEFNEQMAVWAKYENNINKTG